MRQRLASGIRLLCLTLACAGAYVLAYVLRFNDGGSPHYWDQMYLTIGVAVIAKLGAVFWHDVHQQHHRFIGFEDLVAIVKAATAGAVALTLLDTFVLTRLAIPRGVVFIDWGATILALSAVRAWPRALHYLRTRAFNAGEGQVRTLIVGADDHGEVLLRALRAGGASAARVVGFVDDDPTHRGRRISGTPVLGGTDQLLELVERHAVEEVLIAGSLPGKQVRQIVHTAADHDFRVRVLPSYQQILDEDVSVQPRSVAIEDLLRREAVDFDQQAVGAWLRGSTVLVTGSAGSIGSEVCRQLLRVRPAKLVVIDRSETGQFFLERELRRLAPEADLEVTIGDLTDPERMEAVFAQHQPDVIFHAAAYKHVPLMEEHPGEAVKNIVLATRNVADLAESHGAQAFVMISTDKAVNPTSVMGSCKQLAERYVQARSAGSSCRFTTVRFGNVLDSAGSVVPVFRQQIAGGGPVSVTHPDIERYFMMIPEASQLVIQAGMMGRGGEIFVLDMGEPVRIMDLARDMIRLSGLKVGEDIEIEITGLRPGEKLYEELYWDSERHKPTSHGKIMVADSNVESLLRLTHEISRLAAVANQPKEVTREALRAVVPLFEPAEATRRAA
ncbi:UDP-N-acetyl-alpha-D-glucosamine C6 dehydratase [Posidoniimonas polymericola]|uniref:UDP-N-acetyl-alpha-D-glucosamine C6 dehydratase n=1 Tax=Posidoniimonas polymericola TaxID=2528002 RepID=A0A5C5YS76_9BACT|nr:nucleoside-diphosphate sugar epimerase/dehydratase [Posidoniimonas polymericola]TWT77789.1 UDP-N-acetyl-alpha-D-glucosamine C6 dehydratase [Posidoniimonas polymericola]